MDTLEHFLVMEIIILDTTKMATVMDWDSMFKKMDINILVNSKMTCGMDMELQHIMMAHIYTANLQNMNSLVENKNSHFKTT